RGVLTDGDISAWESLLQRADADGVELIERAAERMPIHVDALGERILIRGLDPQAEEAGGRLLLRPALWRLERQLLCRNGHGGREHGAHGGKRDEHSNEHGLPCHVGHAFPSADRTRYGNNSQVSPTPAL